MSEKLLRVGTTYLPVRNVELSANWYVTYLQAVLSYQDEDKAIVNFADQSFFLVKAEAGETSNFKDSNGHVQFL